MGRWASKLPVCFGVEWVGVPSPCGACGENATRDGFSTWGVEHKGVENDVLRGTSLGGGGVLEGECGWFEEGAHVCVCVRARARARVWGKGVLLWWPDQRPL